MNSSNKNYDNRIVIIDIKSHTGDKVKLNLPVYFLKRLIKNNGLDFFIFEEEIVDTKKIANSLLESFNYNITGNVVYLERYNGDLINIKIK